MRLHSSIAVLVFLSAGPAAANGTSQSAGLCSAQETVYFTCPVTKTRWISLCGSAPGALQYRFGRIKALELQYPERAADGADRMLFAQYGRFQTERIEVRFENYAAEYVLFDYREGARREAGVRVTAADGKEREIACSGPVASRLGELKGVVRCDPDSALNNGNCP